MNVTRYYHTVRHLKPVQIIYQLLYRGKRLLPRAVWKVWLPQNPPSRIISLSRPFETSPRGATFIAPSTLILLQKTHNLTLYEPSEPFPRRWFPEHLSHLELFHLHYFDYLHDVDERATGVTVIERWIEEVPEVHPVGWHPYPTARRICNWIFFFSRVREGLSQQTSQKILTSLYRQLHYLHANLEYHLLGNHLFENIKALIIGALFFEDSTRLKVGLSLLKRELESQILQCGGHYEQTPGYHLLVLEGLAELGGALQASKTPIPAWLQTAIEKMSLYAEALFGAGHYPAFNDSSEETSLPWSELKSKLLSSNLLSATALSAPMKGKAQHLEGSGIIVFSGEKLTLYFDAGVIGPDHLPGHAHNDTLSFLLYSGDTTILTDSGVYEYAEGYWRSYFRSAWAHNGITIDNEEPNDIWKSFRVGYRGYPYDIKVGERSFGASDSAYERLGVKWRRSLFVDEHEQTVTVKDTLLNRKRARTVEWYFHLAPGFTAETLNNHITLKNSALTVTTKSDSIPLFAKRSWYSKHFGEKEERLMLTGKAPLPVGEHIFETTFQVTRNEPSQPAGA